MLTKFRFKKIFILFFAICACTSESKPNFIACGGSMNLICPVGAYCQFLENCGGLDNDGYCAPIPPKCPLEEDIVCGCDNKEYLNTCIANTLSTSVKNPGKCIKPPKIEVNPADDE